MARIVNPVWADVSDEKWNDWRWQQRERVTKLEELEPVINLSEDERRAVKETSASFEMAITPYYASLMDKDNPECPVRLQSVPVMRETEKLPEDRSDPLGEEKDMVVPGITHRYPDRVLFYTTHNCPVYCRHCTRKRKVSDPESAASKNQIETGLEYIRTNEKIRDVVISGGDPLSLSDKRLGYILNELASYPHIEMCRLGTRNLVTLPQRINDDFISMLKEIPRKHLAIYTNTHFNHDKECTDEAWEACDRLSAAGVPLANQMVLMKGINDDPKIVKKMNQQLLRMRVRPYYIYQSDLAEGISHFRTPIDTGIRIIEALRGHTSGMAVPQLVIDGPGGGGKIPINPEYILERNVEKDGRLWLKLRNFNKQVFYYPE